MIKSRARRAGDTVLLKALESSYNILVVKLEGKRSLGRPRCKHEYNIKIDVRE
jgi:hypothetical protein